MPRTDLSRPPAEPLQVVTMTGSALHLTGEGWRFSNRRPPAGGYTNAQVDDYRGLPRRSFCWRAPLRMEVRARFSHTAGGIKGTAGFGFWNDPFMMTGFRMPSLPRAVWFFCASPESNMKLAKGVPGSGWKAAVIDAWRLPFFLLLPTAPLAVPLMRVKRFYDRFWPAGQQAIGVCETLLVADMAAWHTYELEWRRGAVRFCVDGGEVLVTSMSPRGRLGFVMWIDNQAMVVTPWGEFGWRTVDISGEQWMEVSHLQIEPLG